MRDTCSPYAARERLACRHGSYGQFEPLIDALSNWDSSRAPSAPLILPSRRGKAFGIADAKTRTGTTIQAATCSQTAAHNAEPRPHRKRGIRRQMRQHARDAWLPGPQACSASGMHSIMLLTTKPLNENRYSTNDAVPHGMNCDVYVHDTVSGSHT